MDESDVDDHSLRTSTMCSRMRVVRTPAVVVPTLRSSLDRMKSAN